MGHWWLPPWNALVLTYTECTALPLLRGENTLRLNGETLPLRLLVAKMVAEEVTVLHWLPWSFLYMGVDCSHFGPWFSGCPGWHKPYWFQSNAGRDIWNKGKCKILSARPSVHDLLWATAPSNGQCRGNQKEKLCFQQNPICLYFRVMRYTYHNPIYSFEGSINTTRHGCSHRENKGRGSPARVWKGQSWRVKKILSRCDITSYIISWPNLSSWISSNQN